MQYFVQHNNVKLPRGYEERGSPPTKYPLTEYLRNHPENGAVQLPQPVRRDAMRPQRKLQGSFCRFDWDSIIHIIHSRSSSRPITRSGAHRELKAKQTTEDRSIRKVLAPVPSLALRRVAFLPRYGPTVSDHVTRYEIGQGRAQIPQNPGKAGCQKLIVGCPLIVEPNGASVRHRQASLIDSDGRVRTFMCMFISCFTAELNKKTKKEQKRTKTVILLFSGRSRNSVIGQC